MKDIYNFLSYDDKLSSSGMPTVEQMNLAALAGVDLIINLAPHDVPNAIPDEGELVHSLGMEYINLPIPWGAPDASSLTQFMDAVDAHRDKKIHVHCEANYRASAFIMLYHVERLGWQTEQAIAVMERMWNPEDFPVWNRFLADCLAGKTLKYSNQP